MTLKFKYSYQVMSDKVSDAGRILIPPKKKIALACSGGATKAGAFHLGVALALQEQGFRFYGGTIPVSGQSRPPGPMEISMYVGSSAGSIISTYLAAGYSLDNIFNSFLNRKAVDQADAIPRELSKLTYQKMFRLRPGMLKEQIGQFTLFRKIVTDLVSGNIDALLQLKWLKTTGIFSTAGIEQYMREEVLPSNRFQDYLADLFIVGTQLNHSRKVVFGKYSNQPPPDDLTCQYENDVPISEACAASTALPVIFAPYPVQNPRSGESAFYVDGEIRDTLSTHVAIDAGADLVFASYTHQPYHLQKEIGSLTEHGLPAIVIQSIYLVVEQKINNHVHNKELQRNVINSVERYCMEAGLPEIHRKRILEIMERELHHRRNVDTIYIHPNPEDAEIFFGEHFSLSPRKMTQIVKAGFKAAIDTLKRYEFADYKAETVVGSAG
jgi:predicted acylesterase/phospholipase RssA